MQAGSVFALLFCAHDWHAGDDGSEQPEVPRGSGVALFIQATACPFRERTSISESFSSLRTTTSTRESGRRNSRRSRRIVVSTPLHEATPPFTTIESYGSGWTRKRYQLSSCDSMPHPK